MCGYTAVPKDERTCLFVILCVCTVTDFSAEATNFTRRFIGILGRESPILGNVAPLKPKIGDVLFIVQ